MEIRMYRNLKTGKICIGTYIEKMSYEALNSIVHEDNIFHQTQNPNQLGFYYSPYTSMLVHDDVWIVKYGHNNYATYIPEDFITKFLQLDPTFEDVKEYLEENVSEITNNFQYEELAQDILKIHGVEENV